MLHNERCNQKPAISKPSPQPIVTRKSKISQRLRRHALAPRLFANRRAIYWKSCWYWHTPTKTFRNGILRPLKSVTRYLACSVNLLSRSYHQWAALSPIPRRTYLGLCISIELIIATIKYYSIGTFICYHEASLHMCSTTTIRHPQWDEFRKIINGVRPKPSTRWIKQVARGGISAPATSNYYQLAFLTPGIRPFDAISRNWIRLIPNWRM